jgi:hypothetical protein
MSVIVVDMVPESHSAETNQDSEPNLAVNPLEPSVIAATAFTPDADPNATHAPIYVSTDGGLTWNLRSIVPFCNGITGDVTLRFSGSNRLYAAYLSTGDGLPFETVVVARTADPSLTTEMEKISQITSGDQPYIQAATVASGPDAGKDRVSDGFAKIHFSLDAASASPTFQTVQLESRGFPAGQAGFDEPQVRTAIHRTGVVYAVYYSAQIGSPSGGANVDVVVVRDDHWGDSPKPFNDLVDAVDGKQGQRAVQATFLPNTSFGQEEGGGELSIAVDHADASLLYIAWADQDPSGYTLHVRRSTDSGQSFPDELRTIPMAQNPALAVADDGAIGFLFQKLVNVGGVDRWETHFQRSPDGSSWEDVVLATVPANTPVASGSTYIGDYVHLEAFGPSFFGVFNANNQPAPADFPHGVIYQRHVKKGALLSGPSGKVVKVSIDPFFFRVDFPFDLGSIRRKIFQYLAIDPLALVLPNDIYVKLNLPRPPDEVLREVVEALAQRVEHVAADVREQARGALAEVRKALAAVEGAVKRT